MAVETPLFQPLLRMMGLPPALTRFAPESADKSLRTLPMSETSLVAGLNATFDETCLVTVVEGDQQRLANVKLVAHGGKRQYRNLHLVLLSTAGQINVVLGDDNLRLFIGAGSIVRAGIQLFGRGTLFIGDRTTMGQARLIVANADMVVGDDCQFSDEIIVQCNDQHPITDLDTGEVINGHRRKVHIDRHVWIGRRAMVMPDVRINEGSVVAAAALVTSDVAANTIVGGVPARLIRERVSWAREFGR